MPFNSPAPNPIPSPIPKAGTKTLLAFYPATSNLFTLPIFTPSLVSEPGSGPSLTLLKC
jgi:hypothetical protein